MSTISIFFLGLLVTIVTFTAALLIGLSEAADPVQARTEDLSDFERKVVGR